ncbi:ATP-binding protein [Streptomyces sp. NPDC048171]|uniref:sensor histidine kinase n=1 Tax=unclassified Streptomyces TaxID=2593676 RepID=UPI00136F815D|nr:PAS domain-containing sensor histidine kinase [Streptomyces sp. SID5789]MZE75330.1 PAS domain S-box protein [Streptomyces sp. SID5789]
MMPSDRKRLSKAKDADHEQQLLTEIVSNVSASVWAAAGPEDDYAIYVWNRGAEKLYGLTRERVLGKSYLDLFVNELERDQAVADHADIVAKRREFRNLANDVMADGSERLLLTVGFALWDEFRSKYLLAELGIDVTDVPLEDEARLRQAREEAIRASEAAAREVLTDQLRQLVGALTLSGQGEDERSVLALGAALLRDAIHSELESSTWLAGRNGRLREAYHTEGWETPEGLDIKGTLKWFSGHSKPIMLDSQNRPHRFAKFIGPNAWPANSVALIPLHAEGTLLGVEIITIPNGHPFTPPQREVVPVLASVVLASARLVAELRRRREEVAESEAETTRLGLNRDFAHRIRKAVDPILRDIQSIRQELTTRQVAIDGELKQCLDDIEDGCTELALAPSDIRRAQQVDDVNLVNVLTALRNRLSLEFPDTHIELQVPLAEDILIRGVRGEVTAVFENLLYNAIEATDDCGTVRVAVEMAGSTVHVAVTDDGPGIPAGKTEEIFSLGFSSRGEGRGLGLARAREIVTKLQGSISASGTQLGGATFLVSMRCEGK